MSASSAFSDEKGGSSSVGEPEYGHDPASGGIFSSDYKRYEFGGCVDAVPRQSREALSVVPYGRGRCNGDVISWLLRYIGSVFHWATWCSLRNARCLHTHFVLLLEQCVHESVVVNNS